MSQSAERERERERIKPKGAKYLGYLSLSSVTLQTTTTSGQNSPIGQLRAKSCAKWGRPYSHNFSQC